jgi:hypothetical protein
MSRTASMQFTFLTREEAIAYLAKFEGPNAVPRTAENHGDRIMAQRRVEYPPPAQMTLAEFARRYPPKRESRVVERLNDQHALILLGDRPVVLREGTSARTAATRSACSRSPASTSGRGPTSCGSAPAKTSPCGRCRRRRSGSSRARASTTASSSIPPTRARGYYNLWKGWAVEPAPVGSPASCQRFLDHVAENVCAATRSSSPG